MEKGDLNWVLTPKINNAMCHRGGEQKEREKGKRRQRSALTGTGGVVGRSTKGIVGLLETRDAGAPRDECGFA